MGRQEPPESKSEDLPIHEFITLEERVLIMQSKHITILFKVHLCLTALMALSVSVWAQDTNSRARTLRGVSISASRPSEVTAQAPVQVLSVERLDQTGATTLSDAVKQIGGVTLKDYGGVGGIKTVSARGLGSHFSTLTIDGVAVNDCQNGQTDLGRYLLGNADYVSFANGQHSDLLQTARGFAAGNVLNMETHKPQFRLQQRDDSTQATRHYNGMLSMEAGSFGLLSPTLSWEQRLGRQLSLSLWANYLQSEGDYPFTIYYGPNSGDSSSRERRQNSQVRMGTVDANLFWDISPSQELTTKIYYTQSFHALPGPVIFYSEKGSESTTNQVFFAQSRYRNNITERLRLQVVGKYSRTADTYDDTAVHSPSGYVHNDYLQQEGYFSASVLYEPWEHLYLSATTDEALATLASNLQTNNEVRRCSSQNVLAVSYRRQQYDLTAHLLGTFADEETNSGLNYDYRKLSPYAGGTLLLWPAAGKKSRTFVRLRYFFKETYRLPDFNEMYYFTMTRQLRPEKALQHNMGLTLSHTGDESVSALLTVDGYFNRVTDKIVAIPMQSLFLWSMVNLGKVNIYGLDVCTDLQATPDILHITSMNLHINYSFQRALDVTDPNSKTYRQQIAYTPLHSGGATLTIEHPWFQLGYSLVWVGDRYRLGQNTANNWVKGYVDQGITIGRDIKLGRDSILQLQAQVQNLFDVQYEVIKNYPMMGRNFRFKIGYKI